MPYKPGNKVLRSGIYDVVHDGGHTKKHQVTCVKDESFPPCNGCETPRFKLAHAALHISEDKHFKKAVINVKRNPFRRKASEAV